MKFSVNNENGESSVAQDFGGLKRESTYARHFSLAVTHHYLVKETFVMFDVLFISLHQKAHAFKLIFLPHTCGGMRKNV